MTLDLYLFVAAYLAIVGVLAFASVKSHKAAGRSRDMFHRYSKFTDDLRWLSMVDVDSAEAMLAFAYEGGHEPETPKGIDHRLYAEVLENARGIKNQVEWLDLPYWKRLWFA